MDVIYTVLEFLLPFEFIDYTFMKKGLENGLLSLERLNEAVLRILATKMANGVFENKKPLNEIDVVGCKEHQELAYQCASKAITLVKNKQDILPITPQKYKNIRLYHLTDTSKGGFKESGSQKKIEDYLNDLGFNVDVYDENQLDFHEIFETGVSYLKDKYDLVIYVADFDTASNYTVRRVEWIKLMAANAPWFVQDIPTLFISLANPYHLLDVPMIKTYINGYSHNDVVIQSLVNKLVGKEKFVGVSPVDAFCGKWDTKR